MIVNIRKLLNKLSKKADNPNEYKFTMEFDGQSFRPAIKNTTTPTVNVRAVIESGAEFVGFAIIAKNPTSGISVLCNNGLFIGAEESRANTILLFPSYAEVVEACSQLTHYIVRASRSPQEYLVYAAYQLGTRNTLEFKKVNTQ